MFTVLVSSKTEFYMILFFPALILLVAAAIADVGERLQGQRFLASAFVVLMAIGVMGFEDNFRDVIQAASDFQERDYSVLASEIQATIPAGSRVVAPPVFWIGLSRPPYYLDYVDFYVWERVRRERNVSWDQFLTEINPQYVILDSKAKSDVAHQYAVPGTERRARGLVPPRQLHPSRGLEDARSRPMSLEHG